MFLAKKTQNTVTELKNEEQKEIIIITIIIIIDLYSAISMVCGALQ